MGLDYHQKLSRLIGQLGDDDVKKFYEYLSHLATSINETTDFLAGLMNLRWTRKEPGHSCCEVEITPALLNPYGSLSGGVLFTMVDYGMGAALFGLLLPGEKSATIEIKLNFLTAVNSGRIVAETRVVHPGRRVVYMESKVKLTDDRLVAVATGSFYRFRVD
jgi:acyl-CoA thioesterase